ncbi:MAG: hypothetical protein H6669_16045 [Ardenticatenaceae bacterium]|nr:hypothetical protein [Ardenticatenaceae bacterium]
MRRSIRRTKSPHNAKYDYRVLAHHGLEVTPIGFDTMIGEWLTDPSSKHLGLKDLAYLGIEMTNIEDPRGKTKNQKTFAGVPVRCGSLLAPPMPT